MIIRNSNVFYKGEVVKKDILTEDEVIRDIGKGFKDDEIIDASNLLVIPGLIDPHVHLREPGAVQKEDFHTGSRAAIAGGFTTVIDMPNNPTPTITKERLDEKIKLASKKAICDVLFHFGTTNDNFNEVKKADPNSLKIYMSHTTGTLLIKDQNIIKKHFENFNKEKPIVLHAEDKVYAETTGDSGVKSAWRGVDIAVNLAKKTNRRIHITHAGTKKEIVIAKKWEKCTVGVAPHYVFLSKKDYGLLQERRFVKPPLKEEKYRMELFDSLDIVDCVGSDHAPHTLEEKKEGAFGFPGLETSFHLFIDSYLKKLVSLSWIIEKTSTNPVKIFGLKNKGEIKKDYFADLTFVDLKKEWTVKGDKLETKCKWSPFEDRKLKGKVVGVMHKGKLKYWENEFQ